MKTTAILMFLAMFLYGLASAFFPMAASQRAPADMVDHLVRNGVIVHAVPANLIGEGPFQGLKWTYCRDPMGNTSELIGRVPGWKWK